MGSIVKKGQKWSGKWSKVEVEVYDVYFHNTLNYAMICYIKNGGNYHMNIQDFINRYNLLEDIEEIERKNMDYRVFEEGEGIETDDFKIEFKRRFNLKSLSLNEEEFKLEEDMKLDISKGFIEVDEVRVGQVWGLYDNSELGIARCGEIENIIGDCVSFIGHNNIASKSEMIEDSRDTESNYRYVCLKDIKINAADMETGNSVGINFGGLAKQLQDENNQMLKDKKIGNFSDILDSIGEMLAEKDKRYGNAALKPLEIFAKHHSYGARLDEKLARVKNSDELRKNDVADIIGGLVLICRDNGWTDFSDQID